MKHLKVTIVNDEDGDIGAVTIRVMGAKGEVLSERVLDEKGEDEFRFPAKGSVVVSAK